jgi:hypothetical protein
LPVDSWQYSAKLLPSVFQPHRIARCRRLAKEAGDNVTIQRLLALAAEYEQQLAAHK